MGKLEKSKILKDELRLTSTKKIKNPRLEIGSETFRGHQIASAHFQIHENDYSQFRSASITLNPPFEVLWDYREKVRIYESDELILTGVCSKAESNEEGKLHLQLRGPLWRLERTALRGLGTFGMSGRERFHWIAKLVDPDANPTVEGLELDNTLRSFMFAVPLENLKPPSKVLILNTDTGITTHEYDDVFRPILAQFGEMEEEPDWDNNNPRLFGVVMANNLLEADNLARDRAKAILDIMNLALRTGMSHFETRYESEPIAFDAETTLRPVSLSPWIIVREASQLKGWVRRVPTAKLESEIRLDDSLGRIRFFLSEFNRVSETGDVHDQLGRRKLSERERKLLLGTKRALRWLNNASSEEDLRDRFTATWIALEAILNSITYPGVFESERATIKEDIRNSIKGIRLPNTTKKSLEINNGMLESRILQNDWSLLRKLSLFAESAGIRLKPDDTLLVRKLSRARNPILHEGREISELSQEQVNQLRYLVERLIVGISIGGYEDLEDRVHKLHIGTIGPEGGAAPITIDGKKDLPYEFRATMDKQGQLVGNWIVEGKIYSDKNVELV